MTPHQTVGPYWHLIEEASWAEASDATVSTTIALAGRIRDGAGAPVTDAMVEAWSPPRSFARTRTDGTGCFRFRLPQPFALTGRDNAIQAPHVQLMIFARGLMSHLTTRVYFDNDPLNDTDPLLELVPMARRATLIAQPLACGDWHHEIVLRGDGETVFLDP